MSFVTKTDNITSAALHQILNCVNGFVFCRQRIKNMFYHAYSSYLDNAFPYDELRPLTCDGQDTWGRYGDIILFRWRTSTKT